MSGNNSFLVSVICVTRNAADKLPALINSLRQYKTLQIEFIVIDGNSTDGTVNTIKANADIIDFWVSEADKGIYDAMNKATRHARGQWLYFIGADDELLQGFTAMLPLLINPNTIYYGGVVFHGNQLSKKHDAYRFTKVNICHQAIFYPNTVFKKYSYDTRYTLWADYYLNLQCWHDKAFCFEYHNHIIANYADGGLSEHTQDAAFMKQRDAIYKKYLGLYAYARYLNRNFGLLGAIKKLLTEK
jgi:glycosyltransferase involved in cell wall biosynthesis